METVFVIGAGASAEVNMPTGNGLKKKICDLLDTDVRLPGTLGRQKYFIYELLRNKGTISDTEIEAKAHIITNGLLHYDSSIDSFLAKHRDDELVVLCGKAAIAITILHAERESTLLDLRTSQEHNANTWFTKCIQKITENCTINELESRLKSISFIIFNYDRCFERFCVNAFQNLYSINEQTSKNIVNSMHIIHPYGLLEGLEFGKELFTGQPLYSAVEKIKIFTEQFEDRSVKEKLVKTCEGNEKRIIFLGFAYHEQNMQLLFPNPKNIQVLSSIFRKFDLQPSGKLSRWNT